MRNGPYELVIAPAGYPGKRYRERYCYEHHLVWWQHHGTLPGPTEEVHHKNHDKRDNRIENLELLTKAEHRARHAAEDGGPDYAEMVCPSCLCHFEKLKRQTHLSKPKNRYTCCSRACSGKVSRLEVVETVVVRVFKKLPGVDSNHQPSP